MPFSIVEKFVEDTGLLSRELIFIRQRLRYLLRKTHYVEIPIHYRAPSPSVSIKAIKNSLYVLIYYFILRLKSKSPMIKWINDTFLIITSIANQDNPITSAILHRVC